MTTLTLSTVGLILYGMLGRAGYGRTLALGGATAAGAAVVVGSTAVPTFYAVAIGAAVAVIVRFLGRGPALPGERVPLPPGVPLLLLFLVWSVVITVVSPLLFNGLLVLAPMKAARYLTAGVLTSSNIAQTIYLVLGIFLVVFIARTRVAGPELVGIAAGLTVLLSFWRYLHQQVGVPFPEGVFDNSPFFAYIETAAGGVKRFRGILSEPSSLAASSLVAVSYMLSRARHVDGWQRARALLVAAIAAFLGTISTSGGFVVAAVVTALIAAVTFGARFLLRRGSVSAAGSIMTCLLIVMALWVLPIVADFVEATVNQKVSSQSYNDRTSANTDSYKLFFDTYGLGCGLGANRASSFFPGLLSTTGLVGTLLFAAVIFTLIRRSAGLLEYRPVIWALVTLIVLKIVAGPDLSDGSGVLWLSLGLLSRAASIAERRSHTTVFPTETPPVSPPEYRVGPGAPVALRPAR